LTPDTPPGCPPQRRG